MIRPTRTEVVTAPPPTLRLQLAVTRQDRVRLIINKLSIDKRSHWEEEFRKIGDEEAWTFTLALFYQREVEPLIVAADPRDGARLKELVMLTKEVKELLKSILSPHQDVEQFLAHVTELAETSIGFIQRLDRITQLFQQLEQEAVDLANRNQADILERFNEGRELLLKMIGDHRAASSERDARVTALTERMNRLASQINAHEAQFGEACREMESSRRRLQDFANKAAIL